MPRWCRLSAENKIEETFQQDPAIYVYGPGHQTLAHVQVCPDTADQGMYLVGGVLSDEGLPNMMPLAEDVSKAEREIEMMNLLIDLGVIV